MFNRKMSNLLTVLIVVAACGDGTTDPGRATVADLQIVDGNQQIGEPGQPLPQPLRVRAVDASGEPVSGQAISFLVTGGGSVSPSAVVTTGDGVAQASWTLGVEDNVPQQVEARAVDHTTGEPLDFAYFTASFEGDPGAGAVQVTSVSAVTGRSYVVVPNGMAAGAMRFTDREYTVVSPVPTRVTGRTYIRTANEDKAVSPGSSDFLSFQVDRDVTVFVAHDDRLTRPTWLSSFTDTGLELRDSDTGTFSVFSRSYAAGAITLGSNTVDGNTASSMYTVIIEGTGEASTDTEPPTVPQGLEATVISTSRIDLTWDASTDNVGVAGYRVLRGGEQVATVAATSFSDGGLTPSTTYEYQVVAVDAAGNASAASAPVSATTAEGTPDTEAPTVPAGLSAEAVSGSRISLEWTAATDNVGVTGYRIYRNGTSIGTTAALSYLDSGLAPNTTYTYTVAAFDGAGNSSAQSAQASATTPDDDTSCVGEAICPAAETPPTLGPAGSSVTDPVFGTRIMRLTDETLCPSGGGQAYSYWSALNADKTLMLANCGEPTLFRVDLVAGSVQKLGPAFQSVALYYEGFIWSRTQPSRGYGALASTSSPQLIEYDAVSHTHTILKDFAADSRFTSAFGASSYLWQLSASSDQTRFAATVRQSGTYKELGLVVYDRTNGQVWTYQVPSGEALDEGQIDRSGQFLVIKIMGREWAVWDLTKPSPSALMVGGPGHSDMGSGIVFQGHGKGMVGWPLAQPGQSVQIYAAPLVDGKINGYADAHTSAVAANGYVYWTSFVEGADGTGGALMTSWTNVSGELWKLDYAQELAQRPTKRLPEVVRMGRQQLRRVGSPSLNRGEWYLDAGTSTLYARNPDGSDPNARDMMAFDWRPIIEEIVRVREDGTGIDRLAHHYSYVQTYNDMPRSSASYDGSVVLFNSNWGGRGRTDVFAVILQ